jgi:transposase
LEQIHQSAQSELETLSRVLVQPIAKGWVAEKQGWELRRIQEIEKFSFGAKFHQSGATQFQMKGAT